MSESKARRASRLVDDGADIIPLDPTKAYTPGTVGSVARRVRAYDDFADAAEVLANVGAYENVQFTRQSYNLGTFLAPDRILRGSGTDFTGGSIPGAISDATLAKTAGEWRGMYMTLAGDATAGSANQSTRYYSAYLAPTNSLASYQKNAGVAKVTVADPSTGMILRDGVAWEMQAFVPTGVMTGRAFGGHSRVDFAAGSDGYTPGVESEVYNLGGNQPLVNQATSKHAFHAVASHGLVTVAFKAAVRDGGMFQHFAYADPESIVANFLLLRDKFAVDKNGQVTLAGIRSYADDAAAAADVTLGSLNLYRVGTNVRIKP